MTLAARTKRRPTIDQPPLEHEADGFGIEAVLLDEDARRQRLDRVVVEHRNRRLQDDRPAVELGGHQMHGRAGHPDAVLERLTLRVEAGKRGQQRRVDVEDAVRKRVEQRRADQPHEAGEADQLHAARREQRPPSARS